MINNFSLQITKDFQLFVIYKYINIENVRTIIYSVYASSDISSIDDLKSELNKGLIGLFNLAQCFANLYIKSHIDLIIITDSAYKVTSDENIISNYVEYNKIKMGIRDRLSRYLYEETECKPMIITVIQEV